MTNKEIDFDNEYRYEEIKTILNSIQTIYNEKQKVNTTAIAIYIDIENSIKKLTDIEKMCIIRHFFNRYTIQEIAQEFEMLSETVEEQIQNALQKMKKYLRGGV